MNTPPTPKKNSALAARWRKVHQLAAVYKETHDPRLREELAGLLWMNMVTDASAIAQKRGVSFHLPWDNREVSEEVVSSVLGKGMTVLLEKHKVEGKGTLRTYLTAAINNKISDYFRENARQNSWQQDPANLRDETAVHAPHAPQFSDIGIATRDLDSLEAPESRTLIERELGLPWFKNAVEHVLDEQTEVPVLVCYLVHRLTRREGAVELGISEALYKSRLEGLVTKLAKHFNGNFGIELED